MSAYPKVAGRCPACCGESLFLGEGGYVTCSRLECSEPEAASKVLEQAPDHEHRVTWGGTRCLDCGQQLVEIVRRPTRDRQEAAELLRAAESFERLGYITAELDTPAVRAALEPLMGRPISAAVAALRAAAGEGRSS